MYDEVSKGALINTAASEAGTGSPTRGGRPETIAIKKGNQWNLNGRKTFTTLSPVLDIFLVTAWVPEDERLGTFLVHRDVKGVSIEETWDMISMQGTGSHDLVLNDVSLPEKYYVMKSNPDEKENLKRGYYIYRLVTWESQWLPEITQSNLRKPILRIAYQDQSGTFRMFNVQLGRWNWNWVKHTISSTLLQKNGCGSLKIMMNYRSNWGQLSYRSSTNQLPSSIKR